MTTVNRPIIAAAIEYAKRGCSVIPMRADKRPAIRAWKSAQGVAAKPEHVEAWFNRIGALAGVGIVLGSVSGDLYVRDFDDPDAYGRWAGANPELAAALPTVRSVRGFHVYARWKGVRTAKLADGELRGEGAYVVAPPSRNVSGAVYAWLVSLPEGELHEADPEVAGLSRAWCEPNPDRATERTERREETERTELPEKTEDPEDTQGTEAIPDERVLALAKLAIERTLPPMYGKRNAHVFRLARALKAIPEMARIPPEQVRLLRPFVREWHRLALPNIQSKDFGVTWGDFAHAWASVRHPEGADVLGDALRAAEVAAPPAWSADYSPQCRLLASLCRELQRRAGKEPFFLSAAKAGECTGVDKGTANRWLAAFIADGALREVSKGSAKTGRASRYLYVAMDRDEAPEPPPAPEPAR